MLDTVSLLCYVWFWVDWLGIIQILWHYLKGVGVDMIYINKSFWIRILWLITHLGLKITKKVWYDIWTVPQWSSVTTIDISHGDDFLKGHKILCLYLLKSHILLPVQRNSVFPYWRAQNKLFVLWNKERCHNRCFYFYLFWVALFLYVPFQFQNCFSKSLKKNL